MTEHQAFLAQARSDLAVFRHLTALDQTVAAECHPLHFLQMATEKVAKAAFIVTGAQFDRYSHVAFSRLPYQLRRRDVARAMGLDFDSLSMLLRRVAPLCREVDELSPAVGMSRPGGGRRTGPNTEYPWTARRTDGTATWIAPCEYQFGLLHRLRRSPDARQLLTFTGGA